VIRARHDRSTRSRARSLLAAAVLGPAALVAATVVPAHPAAAGAAPGAAAARPSVVVRPVVEVAPVAKAAAIVASHRVQPGETLSHISARYGTSVSALAAANGLANPNLVLAGTVLQVPAAAPVSTGGSGGGGSTGGSGLPSRLQASPLRQSYIPIFDHWAAANGIPADLLKAMTWLESGWQNHLVSSTGAVGIGQLMPDTVDHMEALIGVDLDPAVVEDNIRMSARFLRWLLARSSTVEVALAGYYQGAASVERIGVLDETRTYVANVLALRGRF
jgi:LysM repeat protein